MCRCGRRGPSTSSSSTCSATARCTGSSERGAGSRACSAAPWPTSSRARQLRRLRRTVDWRAGPAARSRLRRRRSRRVRVPTRATPAVRSRTFGRRARPCRHRTRRAASPSRPYNRSTVRLVEMRATGRSGRSRTMASTTSRKSSGTVSSGAPDSSRAVRTSVLASASGGKLQVPARIGSTGAAAQRDPVRGQILVRACRSTPRRAAARASAPPWRPTTVPRRTGRRCPRRPRTCARPPCGGTVYACQLASSPSIWRGLCRGLDRCSNP